MSTTPGAELARLKIAYPGWLISRAPLDGDPEDQACKAEERNGVGLLVASSPALLENLLMRESERRANRYGMQG